MEIINRPLFISVEQRPKYSNSLGRATILVTVTEKFK